MLIATIGLSVPVLSDFLQRYLNQALGPILVLTGAVLLDLWPWHIGAWRPRQSWTARLLRGGAWGSAGLGVLLALAFCPVSAALFFGSLMPLALKTRSWAWLPIVYGLATGLPVLLFATVIAGGASSLSKSFARVAALERWTRIATGSALVLLGIYLTLKHIFRIL
jgi:cytochrome c biogenesis protein CcdA